MRQRGTGIAAVLTALAIALSLTAPDARAKDKDVSVELSLELGKALTHYSLPAGFNQVDFEPPILVGLDVRGGGAFVELRLGFPRHSIAPLVGASAGPSFGFPGGRVEIGIEGDTHTLLDGAPAEGTFLRGWKWGFLGRLDAGSDYLRAGAELRWIARQEATVGSSEGLTTRIGYDSSIEVTPFVRIGTPVGLMAEGRAGFYRLGAAGIASKEFAFQIPANTVFRPELGAGLGLGPVELWVRAAAVFGADDDVEHLHQAPDYMNDYLMAPRTIFAEVRWKL